MIINIEIKTLNRIFGFCFRCAQGTCDVYTRPLETELVGLCSRWNMIFNKMKYWNVPLNHPAHLHLFYCQFTFHSYRAPLPVSFRFYVSELSSACWTARERLTHNWTMFRIVLFADENFQFYDLPRNSLSNAILRQNSQINSRLLENVKHAAKWNTHKNRQGTSLTTSIRKGTDSGPTAASWNVARCCHMCFIC